MVIGPTYEWQCIYQMYKIINASKIHPLVSHVETRKSLTSQVLAKNLSNATDFKMTWYCNLSWRFLYQHSKPVQSAKVLFLSKSAKVQSIYTVTLKWFNEITLGMDSQLRFSILPVVYVWQSSGNKLNTSHMIFSLIVTKSILAWPPRKGLSNLTKSINQLNECNIS